MLASTAKRKEPNDRDDLIARLASAWAMERKAVQRTLSRHAKHNGMSPDELAQSHVHKMTTAEALMSPIETLPA